MKRNMMVMLIALGVLFAIVFGYKIITGFLLGRKMAELKNVPQSVSAVKVGYQYWQPSLTAAGSFRAPKGVEVTTELAGLVRQIYFTPGTTVKQGTLLVLLNIDSDVALLHSLQANYLLAQITYHRDRAQYAIHAVSKQTLDTDCANMQNYQAQVEQQKATIAKKIIRAPFTGRLGVSQVNPGQNLNPGDPVVSLQALDPLWVDFFVPQQTFGQIRMGEAISITTNTYPKMIFNGRVSTINPIVDTTTRNIEIEALAPNPHYYLLPGMYGKVTVNTGAKVALLTLPQTAITNYPYGDVVYVIHQSSKDKKGNPILTVQQTFVKTGDTRGEQIAILAGLKAGDVVVSAGSLKLQNGSRVVINNTYPQPGANPAPQVGYSSGSDGS